ncbi:MAG: hypothetical protein A2X94_15605 [Bdellovibrionales bacterium GWB1_55_8]|nr:MAG: hypothetical protein A2X94_15605 [Bdellovibrionales bacterium GWB1_55_8]
MGSGSTLEKLWALLMANTGAKIISVLIAVVLWVVVLGSRNVEATKEIPLEVVTPANVLVANDVPDKIAFRLSGPKAFLRAVLDRRDDPIRVNLAGAKPGLVTYRFFSDNIRLPIGVKVLSIMPASIPIRLEALKHRDVPLKVDIKGVPPEGFRVAKVAIEPEVVRLKGAESRINTITQIATAPIDVSELKQSFEREVALDLFGQGVQVDGPLPKVRVEIEAISANFRIKNVDIRVLSSYKIRLEEKTVTVFVRVDPKDLKSLDRNSVFAVVDLQGKPKGKYIEPIRVKLPEGVGLVRVVPERAQVTLY